MPTGSIIAATVCSPMIEASSPETTQIPKQIFVRLCACHPHDRKRDAFIELLFYDCDREQSVSP